MKAMRALVLPLALLAAALLIALLAVDVDRWGDAMRKGDARYESAPRAAAWTASSILPFDTGRRVLGLGDDIAARKALQRYRATASRHARLDDAADVAAGRAEAEAALSAGAQNGSAATAAQAQVLLGILAFGDFARGGGGDVGQAETAVTAFDSAVRGDPSNEAARFDLELALRALAARGVRVGPGNGSATGPSGRRGAGGGLPGRGY